MEIYRLFTRRDSADALGVNFKNLSYGTYLFFFSPKIPVTGDTKLKIAVSG